MNDSSKKNNKKTLIILVIFTILILLIALALIYLFKYKEENKKDIFFDSGSITMRYSNNSNIYFLKDMLPLDDDKGKLINNEKLYYDFTIDVNLGDSKYNEYEILIKLDKELTNIPKESIKLYLEKQDSGTYLPIVNPILFSDLKNKSKFSNDSDSVVLTTVVNEKSDYHNYRFRMWLDDKYNINLDDSKSCGIEINVTGKAKSY